MSCSNIAVSSALSRSGRFKVMVATPAVTEYSIAPGMGRSSRWLLIR